MLHFSMNFIILQTKDLNQTPRIGYQHGTPKINTLMSGNQPQMLQFKMGSETNCLDEKMNLLLPLSKGDMSLKL